MTIVDSITNFSLIPISTAHPIRKNHKNSSCIDSIIARGCFALQVITSAIALPIIFAVGLLSGMLRGCCEKGKENLKEMVEGLVANLIAIPISIIGIIAPLSTTNSVLNCIAEEN